MPVFFLLRLNDYASRQKAGRHARTTQKVTDMYQFPGRLVDKLPKLDDLVAGRR